MTEQKNLDIQEIKKIIPHRYPILLVDKITDLYPGHYATGIKNVTVNEPYFQGHFPDNPLMPGVLMVEAMAQVGAVSIMSLPENEGELAVFRGVDKVKFKRQVVPGETLTVTVELSKIKGSMGKGSGTVYVGDEMAVQGELTFALVDQDDQDS